MVVYREKINGNKKKSKLDQERSLKKSYHFTCRLFSTTVNSADSKYAWKVPVTKHKGHLSEGAYWFLYWSHLRYIST